MSQVLSPSPARSTSDLVENLLVQLDELDDDAVFLSLVSPAALRARAVYLDSLPAEQVPLRGLVFAVKDNIDVAAMPTTCACPAYAYTPQRSAPVVDRLVEAGALLVGKTNMDQFATGLVGTRSPSGTPRNPIDASLVPGGSSSGSAVAVATGIADFSLGTDTAGSGRVPAAMCGIVGVKPTLGRVPAAGVVPAVQSIDCVSLFVRDLALVDQILPVISGAHSEDPFSRQAPANPSSHPGPIRRLGVVASSVLREAGADEKTIEQYDAAVAEFSGRVEFVPFDLAPLLAVGDLLYGGPWLAERTAAVGDFIDANLDKCDPVVGPMIVAGFGYSAVDAYCGSYKLQALKSAKVAQELAKVDAFAVPTVPFAATIADVEADPVDTNTALGRFTTFANLLDLCALALPSPAAPAPFGLTLCAPAWADEALIDLAMGREASTGTTLLAVAGAHLKGQPLAPQLENLGAVWDRTTRTVDSYRLFALPGGPPYKPALVHDPDGDEIEVDLWRLDDAALGAFLQLVPSPLALGQVELIDGQSVVGFVSEPRATDGATEITEFGGWRRFVAQDS